MKLEKCIGLILYICVAMEDIYHAGDINRGLEDVGGNINISSKHSLGHYKQSSVNHVLMMNFQ
jgi:hypothetical protein